MQGGCVSIHGRRAMAYKVEGLTAVRIYSSHSQAEVFSVVT